MSCLGTRDDLCDGPGPRSILAVQPRSCADRVRQTPVREPVREGETTRAQMWGYTQAASTLCVVIQRVRRKGMTQIWNEKTRILPNDMTRYGPVIRTGEGPDNQRWMM